MKHSLGSTIVLLALFLTTQLFGLMLILQEANVSEVDGVVKIDHGITAIGERPELSGLGAIAYLVIGIGVGTALLLVLIRLKKVRVWRAWYWLAVVLTIAIAVGTVAPEIVAWALAIGLATWKVLRPHPLVHNATEVLIASGLAVLLVPILSLSTAILLLVLISLYDAYAVWKSKHMVTLATFQGESGLFAGLVVPSSREVKGQKMRFSKRGEGRASHAVLGGGDLAFPLLFSGAVLEWLLSMGIYGMGAFWLASITSLGGLIALAFLFARSERGKFYPAMPFISAGLLVGLAVTILLV